MYKDEIIAEVWKNRDAYSAKHNHNLADMVADLKARQERSDCELVDRSDLTTRATRTEQPQAPQESNV